MSLKHIFIWTFIQDKLKLIFISQLLLFIVDILVVLAPGKRVTKAQTCVLPLQKVNSSSIVIITPSLLRLKQARVKTKTRKTVKTRANFFFRWGVMEVIRGSGKQVTKQIQTGRSLYVLVSKEEDLLQPESHPRVGSVCNGAYSSRWDGDRVCGSNHQTGEINPQTNSKGLENKSITQTVFSPDCFPWISPVAPLGPSGGSGCFPRSVSNNKQSPECV